MSNKIPMKMDETERGFSISKFYDDRGRACSIQESSLATEACIWMGPEEAVISHGINKVDPTKLSFERADFCTERKETMVSSRMHLTVEMVRRIIQGMEYIRSGAPNTIGETEQPEGTNFVNSPVSFDFYDRYGAHCRFGTTGNGCVLGIARPQITYGRNRSWGHITFEELAEKNIRIDTMMHLSTSRMRALGPVLDHFVKSGNLPK